MILPELRLNVREGGDDRTTNVRVALGEIVGTGPNFYTVIISVSAEKEFVPSPKQALAICDRYEKFVNDQKISWALDTRFARVVQIKVSGMFVYFPQQAQPLEGRYLQ